MLNNSVLYYIVPDQNGIEKFRTPKVLSKDRINGFKKRENGDCIYQNVKCNEDWKKGIRRLFKYRAEKERDALYESLCIRTCEVEYAVAELEFSRSFQDIGGARDFFEYYELTGDYLEWANKMNEWKKYCNEEKRRGRDPQTSKKFFRDMIQFIVAAKKQFHLTYSYEQENVHKLAFATAKVMSEAFGVCQSKKEYFENTQYDLIKLFLDNMQLNASKQGKQDKVVKTNLRLWGKICPELTFEQDYVVSPHIRDKVISEGESGVRDLDIHLSIIDKDQIKHIYCGTSKKVKSEGGGQRHESNNAVRIIKVMNLMHEEHAKDETVICSCVAVMEGTNEHIKKMIRDGSMGAVKCMTTLQWFGCFGKWIQNILGRDIIKKRLANFENGRYLPLLGD